MSILINRSSKVVVQGITGKAGTFFTKDMIQYGTRIVAGVTPGKGGVKVEGVPVFDSVLEAVEKEAAETSIIFIPAALARDSIMEHACSRHDDHQEKAAGKILPDDRPQYAGDYQPR
jgi:succinyl-CoA synthetase alpha subunit